MINANGKFTPNAVSMKTVQKMLTLSLTKRSLQDAPIDAFTPTTSLEKLVSWLMNIFTLGAHQQQLDGQLHHDLANIGVNAERIVKDLLVCPFNPDGTTQVDPRIEIDGRVVQFRQDEGGLTVFDFDHPEDSMFVAGGTVRQVASSLLIAYLKMMKMPIPQLDNHFHIGSASFSGITVTREDIKRINQDKGDLRGVTFGSHFVGDHLDVGNCLIDDSMANELISQGVDKDIVIQALLSSREKLGQDSIDLTEFNLPQKMLENTNFDYAIITSQQCQDIINAGGSLDRAILQDSVDCVFIDLQGANISKEFALHLVERGVPKLQVVQSYIASERAKGNTRISLEEFQGLFVDLSRFTAEDVDIPANDYD